MRAFKHHESQYTTGMLSDGRFRIGTLSAFRSMKDEEGSLIPDKMEGRLRAMHHPVVNQPTEGMLRQFIEVGPRSDIITDVPQSASPSVISGNTFSFEYPDLYILCFSRTAINDGAYPEQRYDGIIAVDRLDEFADRMRQAHSVRLGEAIVGDVLYVPRLIDINHVFGDSAGPFFKDPLFFAQREVRIAWQALDRNPTPFISECQNVADLLTKIK